MNNLRLTIIIFIFLIGIVAGPVFSQDEILILSNYDEQQNTDNPYELKFLEKQVVFLYSMEKNIVMDKVIIMNKGVIPRNERASQIEVLSSTIDSNLDEDYISCGVFEIDPTEDTVICNFEPVETKFVRLKIIASWGANTGKIGEMKIGRSGAKLMGKVIDSETKEIIPDAGFVLIGGEETKSNEKGEFNFDYLKIGTYRILVYKSGYSPLMKTIRIDSSRNKKLEVSLSPSKTDIFGIVIDELDHVLEGVEITIKNSMKAHKTDANGLYTFENLKAGSVEIIISKPGYYTVIQEVLIRVGIQKRFDIVLKAGVDEEPPVPLKLSPYAYSPNNPSMIGYPAQTLYVNFNEPLERDALNIMNYEIIAYSGDPETGLIKKYENEEVLLNGIAFHRGDKSLRTVKFSVSYKDDVKKMPFIELIIKGLTDAKGNKIPESGYMIRNFSNEIYSMNRELPLETGETD